MKKTVTTIFLSSLTTLSLFAAVIYFSVSCNKDSCKTVICANGGVCNHGNCICPTGYEGVLCSTVSRDKFTGLYQVREKSGITETVQYGTTISPDPDPKKINYVQITNFWNYFTVPIKAYVVEDTIYIPNQNIQGHVIVGTGIITPLSTYGQFGSINLYYKVIDTSNNDVFDYGFYTTDNTLPSVWDKN